MSKKQTGSTHVIVISLLMTFLVGSLLFIFWQNVINKPQSETKTNNSAVKKDQSSANNQKTSSQMGTSASSTDNINYFTIDEWKVRFKVPDALKDTSIGLYTGSGVGYPGKGLVTTRMKNDAGCGQSVNVYLLRRDKQELYEATGYTYLKNEPINGYWYSTSSTRSYTDPRQNTFCSNPSLVAQDATALWGMLDTIEAVPAN